MSILLLVLSKVLSFISNSVKSTSRATINSACKSNLSYEKFRIATISTITVALSYGT